jgi:AdoMet-dependent rRNA methyltransferase SPB1
MTDKERSREIKGIYKRAGLLSKKKTDIKYVVSKKGRGTGKPQGVKGPYKKVDKRLKADKYKDKQRMKNHKPTVTSLRNKAIMKKTKNKPKKITKNRRK